MADEDTQPGEASEVVVWAEDGRLLVAGERGSVDAFLGTFDATKQLDISDLRIAADWLAAATSALGVAKSGGRYVEVSKETWKQLQQGRLQSAGGGWLWGFARDASGKFAGNAKFRAASLAGTRGLSLQLAVATAALRLAMQEGNDAVEAVAEDVEILRKHAEAAEIGNLAGLYRVLANARKQADDTGSVSQATWDAIAAHEVTAQQGADRARALIQRTMRDLPLERDFGERADAAERLVREQALERPLQLLVLAEQCRLLYRSLKLEHVQSREPDEIEGEITAARQLLTENAAADRALIDELHETLTQLGSTSAFDGLRWFSRGKLPSSTTILRQHVERFADLRGHQLDVWDPGPVPKTGDAFKEFAGRTHRGMVGARNQFGGFVEQLGQRMQGAERHGHETEDSDESTGG